MAKRIPKINELIDKISNVNAQEATVETYWKLANERLMVIERGGHSEEDLERLQTAVDTKYIERSAKMQHFIEKESEAQENDE